MMEQAAHYCAWQGMCGDLAILVDLSRSSHVPRLRVVNPERGELLFECLAASGRGRSLSTRLWPQTGDQPDSWLTPVGRCRVGERYEGVFGGAYRLDGLDDTNRNVRSRAIVLHSSEEVPERNFSLCPLWCSRGCIVVSRGSFARLDELLAERRDVLLWMYR
ncbi:MAG: murein L,D-transpeptidase catalytic domain family protein [Rikenellaceae bacterium]|nr:murein L,D-transpeptidase catalytic domain family protein [Rikenellaceae bacterium]